MTTRVSLETKPLQAGVIGHSLKPITCTPDHSHEGQSDLVSSLKTNIASRERNIQQEHLAIAEHRRYLNSLLPVSMLSAEILTHIFSFFSWDYTQFPSITESPYQYMALAQVCSRWRAVALSKESSWSIYLGTPDHVSVLLQRSGRALIDVISGFTSLGQFAGSPEPFSGTMPHFFTPKSLVANSFELILEQFHRVRSLMLSLPGQVIEDMVRNIGTHELTAPALRRIVLCNSDGDHSPPIILSPRHFPALTHLELLRYSLIWYPTFYQFTTLETIIIQNAQTPTSQSCIIRGLMQVLSNNPRLRVLEIRDRCCPETLLNSHPASRTTYPPVVLFNLKKLIAYLDPGCVNFFLAQCELPPLTTTDIHAGTEGRFIEKCPLANPRPIVSQLAQRYSKMTGLELTLQTINSTYIPGAPLSTYPGCEVTFVICHSDYESSRPTSTALDDVSYNRRDILQFLCPFDGDWVKTLQDTIRLLPLTNVEYLKLTLLSWHPDWWDMADPYAMIMADVIKLCHPLGIRTLNLDELALFVMPNVLASLYPEAGIAATTEKGHDSPNVSLFNSLRTLVISRTDDEDDQGSGEIDHFGNVIDAFCAQAMKLRETGICTQFSTLILHDCLAATDTLLELVDSIADLVQQRGRFTINPPAAPYLNPMAPNPSMWHPNFSPTQYAREVLPDADLDIQTPYGANTPIYPGDPPMVCWYHYASYRRVIFDFRGSSGIHVDHGF